MRYNVFSLLATSLLISLVKSLSSGPSGRFDLFNFDSYDDVPFGLGESDTLAEADLNTQPVSETIFSDPSGSSEQSDDLFESQDYSSFSSIPDSSTTLDTLIALDPNLGSLDTIHADLASHGASGNEGKPPDLGETLENYIDEGLNYLLQYMVPLDKECDLKENGRIPLCCSSKRKALPRAYDCKNFDPSDIDCKLFNYQFCCLGFNYRDAEGIGCTKGFYVAGVEGELDDVSVVKI